VNLLVTLVRYGGDDLLGVLSRKHRLLYEVRPVPPFKSMGPSACFPVAPLRWILTLASLLGTSPLPPSSPPSLSSLPQSLLFPILQGAGVDPETRLRSDLVPEQLRRNMHALVDGAFDLLSKQLEAMHKQLRDTVRPIRLHT
jgi:hypothetical protein